MVFDSLKAESNIQHATAIILHQHLAILVVLAAFATILISSRSVMPIGGDRLEVCLQPAREPAAHQSVFACRWKRAHVVSNRTLGEDPATWKATFVREQAVRPHS